MRSPLFNVASRKSSIAMAGSWPTNSAMPHSFCLAIPWHRSSAPSRPSAPGSHCARRSGPRGPTRALRRNAAIRSLEGEAASPTLRPVRECFGRGGGLRLASTRLPGRDGTALTVSGQWQQGGTALTSGDRIVWTGRRRSTGEASHLVNSVGCRAWWCSRIRGGRCPCAVVRARPCGRSPQTSGA